MGLIRILLALAVCISHSSVLDLPSVSGATAVRTFFVLCGFMMTFVLRMRYPAGQLRLFYGNRLLRIFPGYLAALGLALLALVCCDIHPFTGVKRFQAVFAGNPGAGALLAAANLFIFGQDSLFLLAINKVDFSLVWSVGGAAGRGFSYLLLPQSWSMAPELLFYLAAPFVVRRQAKTICLMAGAAALIRLIAVLAAPGWGHVLDKMFPFTLVYFLGGSLAFLWYDALKPGERLQTLGWGVLLLDALLIVWGGRLSGPVWEQTMPLLIALSLPLVFAATRNKALDRFLAGLSYPMYLLHFTLLAGLEGALADRPWLLLVIVGFCSVLLWVAVEVPLEGVRQRRVRPALILPPRISPFPGAVMASKQQTQPQVPKRAL